MSDLIDEESRLLKTNEEEPASLLAGSNETAMEEVGPWPSTFERSIKLLAGPQTDVDHIDRITRSPRFVPIQAAKARKKLKRLGRGYVTPDPAGQSLAISSPEYNFAPMKKTQSLGYPNVPVTAKTSSLAARELEQKRKLAQAAAYRQKVLAGASEQAKKYEKEDDDIQLSPGYHREKASDKHKFENKTDEQKSKSQTATFWQCVFNLSNTLMGVGMLGLPFIFKSAGWIGGFFVCIAFAAITWRTSILIGRTLNGDPRPSYLFNDSPYNSVLVPGSSVDARIRKPLRSFPEMARESFGQTGTIALSSVLYFELFSCLCIFLVSVGDHLKILYEQNSLIHLMTVTTVILILPLTILNTPRLLSYLSFFGTMSTVFVVLAVFFSALTEGEIIEQAAEAKGIINEQPDYFLWRTKGLPLAFGMIAYTFSGHAIVPAIYASMERPQDYEKMVNYTYIIVCFCCFLVAIGGYYMFGNMVDDQVTLTLDAASDNPQWAMQTLTWLMILTAFSKFVLTMFPLALGIEELIVTYIHSEKGMVIASATIKIVYNFLALCVAVYVPSFSFVCALVGLICTMSVSVIFPAAAHLKLYGPHLGQGEKVIDWIFIIGGIAIAVIGTIATL